MPTVKWNGKALKKDIDYIVTYPSDGAGAYKEPGTYVIHVEAKEGANFVGGFDVPFTIAEKNTVLASKLTVKAAAATYTGAPIETSVTVKKGSKLLTEGVDYIILGYTDNTEIGTASVTIQGIGGYVGTKTASFKIKGIAMSKVKVDGITTMAYDGIAKKQTNLVVTYQENKNSDLKTLIEGKDYTVTYSNNIKAGTASLKIQGKGYYSGSVTKKFTITKAVAVDVVKMDSAFNNTVVYSKGGAKPVPDFYFGAVKLVPGVDYTLSYANNTKVTTAKPATVKATFKGNFAGSITTEFNIVTGTFQKATLDAANMMVSAKAGGWKQSKISIYDANGKKLSAGTDYNKALVYSLDEQGTKVLDGSEVLSVGTRIYVTAHGIKNYEGARIVGSYYIAAGAIKSAKVTVRAQSYTGKAVTLTKDDLDVKVGSEQLVYGVDYIITKYSKNVNKGTAKVTLKGIGNYCGEKTVAFIAYTKFLTSGY